MMKRFKSSPPEADPPRPRRARLQDVATLAGVSLGSASRALSMPDRVPARTRERVLNAVGQLGYVPHGAARALASRRSRLVGAVLPTINNPIYADFCQSLQRTLGEHGYQLLVAAHEYDSQAEARVVERLLQHGVDALALVGTDHAAALWQRLARTPLPCVCAWSVDEPAAQARVGIDNRRAMRALARHLLDLGHRRFAVIAGDGHHNERTRARLDGMRDALAASGIDWSGVQVCNGAFSIEAGRTAMARLLAQAPRPTAVVCHTDLLAAGAIAQARAHGLRVPQDVSITGFDDIALAALLDPPLTTVRVDTARIGQLTAESLLAACGDHAVAAGGSVATVSIDTEVVVRASSAPPPAG